LNLDKKAEALNAFKCIWNEFYLAIQEDASLNYAKLSYYEIGIRTECTFYITSIFKTYPNNASKSVVKLLIDSYISSKKIIRGLSLIRKTEALK
jgi:hypothetical protein